jgi:glutathione S-transferase
MQLYIGNKNYSSWSMRPWVLLKQAGIPFDEAMLPFDGFDPGSTFKRDIGRLSGAGCVPVLVDDDLVVWDTLAIAEYVAERFADRKLWPADRAARARARSVCAEMHSGFGALRSYFGMNIEAALPEVGARVLKEQPAVRGNVDRVVAIWSELLARHDGPMLFGAFSIADAYFAPVVMRFRTYGVPLPAALTAYCERVVALPGVAAWIADALAEKNFLPFEEAYRTSRTA